MMEEKKTYNVRFPHGSTHLVVGPSASGKTYRTCEILRSKDKLIEGGEKIKNVVFCYAAWQPIMEKLKQQGIVTKFVNSNPTSDEFVAMVKDYVHDGGSIVVIDDFMTQISKEMVDIVTVQSRHHNTSTFILFQSLFPPHKLARQISLQVKFLHVHKNPRENAQIETLARQIMPKKVSFISAVYHEVTKVPHSALLIDLTQSCPENLRYRSHYLPYEKPMRVYVPKGCVTV